MQADISTLESLQTAAPPTGAIMVDFKPGVAACLLKDLNAEAERFAMMQAGFLNGYEKFNRDFESVYATIMDYAGSGDSPQAREIAVEAQAVKDRLDAEKERCRAMVR